MASFIPADALNGTISNTQVAFGDSDGNIAGSDDLTWDDTNKQLTVVGDADNDAVVEIVGSESAVSEGPRLVVKNDVGTPSAVDLSMDNYAVGVLRGGTPGGTMREVMRFGQMSSNEFVTRFNNGGLPSDFAVATDTNSNLFYIDGSQNNIGIGGTPPADVERLHIIGAGTNDMVRITSTATGSSDGPDLILNRAKNPGAIGDFMGRLSFRGKNDLGQAVEYGAVRAYIADDTDTTEDGLLQILIAKNGTTTEGVRVSSSTVEINNTQADIDFKVKSTRSAAALLVNAATGDIALQGEYGAMAFADSSTREFEVYKLRLKDEATGTASYIYDSGNYLRIQGNIGVLFEGDGSESAWLFSDGFGHQVRRPSVDLTSANYTSFSSINRSGSLYVVENANATYNQFTIGCNVAGNLIRIYNKHATQSVTVNAPSGGTILGGSSMTLAPTKMVSAIAATTGEYVLI
jgi:hypothetical protein